MRKAAYNVDLTLKPIASHSMGKAKHKEQPAAGYSREAKTKGVKKKCESSESSSTSSSDSENERQPFGLRQTLEPWRYARSMCESAPALDAGCRSHSSAH